jgi:hypothetical protein
MGMLSESARDKQEKERLGKLMQGGMNGRDIFTRVYYL